MAAIAGAWFRKNVFQPCDCDPPRTMYLDYRRLGSQASTARRGSEMPSEACAARSFFVEGGAMDFIKKSAITTNEYWFRVILKLPRLRSVIVRWSTLFRPRLGA